jgi:hypothetical protein
MTVRARKRALRKVGNFGELVVWSYRTQDHILDAMTKPGYFAPCADRLRVGDVVLVECPGYFDIQSVLGGAKAPVRRPGGGVLQIDSISELNLVATRVVGRGLRAFVNPTETVIWNDGASAGTVRASSQKTA